MITESQKKVQLTKTKVKPQKMPSKKKRRSIRLPILPSTNLCHLPPLYPKKIQEFQLEKKEKVKSQENVSQKRNRKIILYKSENTEYIISLNKVLKREAPKLPKLSPR